MSKKKKNDYSNKILRLLKASPSGMSAKELSRVLDIHKSEYRYFRAGLEKLLSQQQIAKSKNRKKYILPPKPRRVVGELSITRGGFGFVHDDETGLDVFISRDHLNTAFDRDTVEVNLYARSRGKNLEGFVTAVKERFRRLYVGTFHESEFYGYVVPDDPKIYRDFFIPREQQGAAANGQKVVIEMTRWDRDHMNPEGKVVEVIGYPGDVGVDVASVAHSYQLNIKFPGEVENEAQSVSGKIEAAMLENRLDLRDEICFTIDPADAKDFDDAVSIKKKRDGSYELGVHIADVSHYVKQDTEVDQEAFKRATSVYLVDRVIPMLPEYLSNDLCSLRPNEDRLSFSCIMQISSSCEVTDYTISPSIIHSKRRFTYEEVQYIVDNNIDDPLAGDLKLMMELSHKLTRKRLDEGGIDFETPEVDFELDETGFPTAITRNTAWTVTA